MVEGGIFPKLMTLFSDQLAVPLTDVYNSITRTFVWPLVWKKEFVTVIPKVSVPQGLSDLRNISCTMLASNIYESYVLRWATGEVSLKSNQYGGVTLKTNILCVHDVMSYQPVTYIETGGERLQSVPSARLKVLGQTHSEAPCWVDY